MVFLLPIYGNNVIFILHHTLKSVLYSVFIACIMPLQPYTLLCPWDFPGNNIGVGCHFLLQGIFPIQGSNPRLLHWQADSLLLSHLGFPRSRVTDRLNLYPTKKNILNSNYKNFTHWRILVTMQASRLFCIRATLKLNKSVIWLSSWTS